MRLLRRHPSRMQLESWFDGEAPEGLAWHLATCTQCFRHVDRLSRIRSAVRHEAALNGPGPSMTRTRVLGGSIGRHPGTQQRPGPGRTVALVGAPVLLLLAALGVGIHQAQVHGTLAAARGATSSNASDHAQHGHAAAQGGSDGSSSAGGDAASAGDGSGSAGTSGRGAGTVPGERALAAGRALVLAVVAPSEGAAAADGAEIDRAAEAAVAQVNAAGGVNGQPVELSVVPAEDSAAVAGLAGHVDALVGGFGAAGPVGVPWILPADPYTAGAGIVSTELTSVVAGARLGADLVARGDRGTVGVIEGTGPDAGLATGLAQEVPTTTVQAPATGAPCLPAVTTLEQRGVVAVAIAGPPDVTGPCMSALSAAAWTPPGGVLVTPSAAYAGVASAAVGTGTEVFTVLGLPWPGSASAGAARFRAANPGVTSYRALVSYAAVELAVEVARTTGAESAPAMSGRSWRNDLYDYTGTTNAGAAVVQESPGGWVSAP